MRAVTALSAAALQIAPGWRRCTDGLLEAFMLVGIAAYTGAMFLLFGFGSKQQPLGPGETRTCPRCQNTTQWTRIREAKQFTLFFIPVARWNRRQFDVCGICGTAVEV